MIRFRLPGFLHGFCTDASNGVCNKEVSYSNFIDCSGFCHILVTAGIVLKEVSSAGNSRIHTALDLPFIIVFSPFTICRFFPGLGTTRRRGATNTHLAGSFFSLHYAPSCEQSSQQGRWLSSVNISGCCSQCISWQYQPAVSNEHCSASAARPCVARFHVRQNGSFF